jgi:hypothetical protein
LEAAQSLSREVEIWPCGVCACIVVQVQFQ